MKTLPGVNPIPIILVSYMRPHLLRRIIKLIDERTFFPHRLIIVHNSPENFEDPINREAVDLIKRFKVTGEVADHIFTEDNLGQAGGQNVGLKWIETNMPAAEYVVFTQDDLAPPDLRPCWLERVKHLIDKYPDYGAIAFRIERTSRLDWDEGQDDLIPSHKSVPAVFRIHRMKELRELYPDPFAGIKRWESQLCQKLMEKLQKKQGFATRLFASHWGYSEENKGYLGEFKDYFSYSPERVHQAEAKPYPEIHPTSLEPLPNQNFPHDKEEFDRRNAFWNTYIGIQAEHTAESPKRQIVREYIGKIATEHGGLWVDMGCGRKKVLDNMHGCDMWPYDGVTYTGDCFDTWWIANNTYDGLCSSHLLEHCKRPIKEALREWIRIVKPGGKIVIVVPDGENRPSTICEPSHNYAFSKGVLHSLLGKALHQRVLLVDNA